jgi:hypothetical protein
MRQNVFMQRKLMAKANLGGNGIVARENPFGAFSSERASVRMTLQLFVGRIPSRMALINVMKGIKECGKRLFNNSFSVCMGYT